MKDKIGIWEVDASSTDAKPVEAVDRADTERRLENILVREPNMLMPGLELVGRQTTVEGGALDLLGVDRDGRLVVFELKRGKLPREAVMQAIDYCSYLESLEDTELATLIAEQSGDRGIDTIEDFEEWYRERYAGKGLSELKPVRMALVGLGVDSRADRMVEFLKRRGMDILFLTFHGYKLEGKTLLARLVEGDVVERNRRRATLAERVKERGMEDLWNDVTHALKFGREHPKKSGFTYYQKTIVLPDNVRVSGSHSVEMAREDSNIRITFFPGAVHMCLNDFQEEKETIGFKTEKPPNAPPTKSVSEQWFCLLDAEEWKKRKEAIATLTKKVRDAWDEQSTPESNGTAA